MHSSSFWLTSKWVLPICFILIFIFTENGTKITGFKWLEVVTTLYLKHFKYQLFSPYVHYLHTMGYHLTHQRTWNKDWKGYCGKGRSIINQKKIATSDEKSWKQRHERECEVRYVVLGPSQEKNRQVMFLWNRRYFLWQFVHDFTSVCKLVVYGHGYVNAPFNSWTVGCP